MLFVQSVSRHKLHTAAIQCVTFICVSITATIAQIVMASHVRLLMIFLWFHCLCWTIAVGPLTVDASSLNRNKPITKMVNSGDRIDIPCSVMSAGYSSVQFYRNGKAITLDFSKSSRRHWSISSDGQASLTINRVAKNDEGLWECWEVDSQGSAKQKATALNLVVAKNVPDEPYIEYAGSRVDPRAALTVREKETISLRCVVSGASPAVRHISWFLDDQNVTHASQLLMEYNAEEDNYDTQSLLVVNVTKELHGKKLNCVAHIAWRVPAVSTVTLNVLYEPSFSIGRDPGFGYPIVEGMSISFKCEIEANPPSPAKWIREGDQNQSQKFNPSRGPEERPSVEGVLNITSVTLADSGWYRCATDHQLGHFASYSFYLNVRSPSTVEQELGQFASFSYYHNVRSTPATVSSNVEPTCRNGSRATKAHNVSFSLSSLLTMAPGCHLVFLALVCRAVLHFVATQQ